MGCVHPIVLSLILETINSINLSPTEVFRFFRTKHCPHAMKPIINHSPIWSTNKKIRGSPPKSVSVAVVVGKKDQETKNQFSKLCHCLQYHVRAEVKEPHRTTRIAEELQQDRLQIHGENPWKGLRYVNTHCLFPQHLKSQKKLTKIPIFSLFGTASSLAFWWLSRMLPIWKGQPFPSNCASCIVWAALKISQLSRCCQ